jgi:hypothetical protein
MSTSVSTSLPPAREEFARSAVSWGAILAGAAVALAVVLVLVTLGAGFGLASISPWPNAGAAATSFAVTTGIGLIVVHWVSSASGGYIAGRLRARSTGQHGHEVFFRDTAHGFLTWAVATLVGGLLLTSAVSSAVGSGARLAATSAGATAGALSQAAANGTAYDVDTLFRADRADAPPTPPASTAEASRILANGMVAGDIPAADRDYLAQLVAARTGLAQPDARKRVDDVVAREKAAVVEAKQTADAARKAGSALAFFTALAMLIGAFIACVAAAYGGSLRDET